jgi:hypothetical protein
VDHSLNNMVLPNLPEPKRGHFLLDLMQAVNQALTEDKSCASRWYEELCGQEHFRRPIFVCSIIHGIGYKRRVAISNTVL